MWHACNFNIYHVVGIYILFLFLFEPTVHLFQIMEKNLIVCTLYIDEMKIQWSIWPEFTVILHIYYTALPVGWDMFCSIEWFFVRKIMQNDQYYESTGDEIISIEIIIEVKFLSNEALT